MKKIASIMCDGGAQKDYRRNIYLRGGRLICDQNDITPQSTPYPRGAKGTAQAVADIEAMYSQPCWELKWPE